MKRLFLVALVLTALPGCGTLTMTRTYDEGSRRPVHSHHYQAHHGWAREIVRSYSLNP